MSYGMNFNMAVTSDGNKSTCGIHLTDSTGLDISREATGDSLIDVFTKAFQSAQSDVTVVSNARKLQEEKKAAEKRKKDDEKLNIKRKKIAALKKQAEELQKEIDEIQSKAKETKKEPSRDILNDISGLDKELADIFKFLF